MGRGRPRRWRCGGLCGSCCGRHVSWSRRWGDGCPRPLHQLARDASSHPEKLKAVVEIVVRKDQPTVDHHIAAYDLEWSYVACPISCQPLCGHPYRTRPEALIVDPV